MRSAIIHLLAMLALVAAEPSAAGADQVTIWNAASRSIVRRRGQLETHVLAHPCLHLALLVATA